MSQTTINPSLDGRIQNSSSSTWSTVRDATTGTVDKVTTPLGVASTGLTAGGNYLINRFGFVFDISSVNGLITSITLRVYGTGVLNGDNDGSDYINTVSFSPASNTDIVAGDFDGFGTTELSSQIDLGSWNTTGYNEFVTSNISTIQSLISGDYLRIGLREGHDILDSAYVGSNDTYNDAQGEQVDAASNKPELVITYTPSQSLFYGQI